MLQISPWVFGEIIKFGETLLGEARASELHDATISVIRARLWRDHSSCIVARVAGQKAAHWELIEGQRLINVQSFESRGSLVVPGLF